MPTDARPQPSEVTPQEARMLAVQYRQMAETVTTAPARRLPLRLAQFYQEWSDEIEESCPFSREATSYLDAYVCIDNPNMYFLTEVQAGQAARTCRMDWSLVPPGKHRRIRLSGTCGRSR
jgi:hypothetical protein